MRKIVGVLLSVAGAGILTVGAMQYIEHQANLKKAMAEANALIGQPGTTDISEETRMTTVSHRTPLIDRSEFKPEQNDVIGLLEIPKLNEDLPIIEGTDEENLARGVGHYSSTVFPSDNEQILLSGHRDTVFRNFGKLAIGDRFIVKLPYGTYEYEIKSTDIVDKDDTTVIRPMGTEVLVVSTCYPFNFVGSAPERYILYAYPVDHLNS
ncbi:class D sortase [Paenibacillus sp. P96]|uniref:Class D sortase n=1 Tax=Paenibacillus zeirhizosphaerae TaxID=2987519 RepID=A0ABT9FV25_9BACL|nr:class D sortase [Paenibacillus sp. P96]MDP4098579.1 class D sortase [Paenibacillus sp. P96]